jgi:GT2 family glycosyltransferase
MAVRREAVEEVGGFDEGFDFLDADTDFSMRLRQAGWQLQKSGEMVAYHEGGGSPQSTAKRVVRHHRNRWQLLRKHGKLQSPELVRTVLGLRFAVEYLLLRTFGALLFDKEATLNDKITGRRKLLKYVSALSEHTVTSKPVDS